MVRGILADRPTLGTALDPLLDQLREHRHEPRMNPGDPGPDHGQAQLFRPGEGFLVEVVQHFDMVREEADGLDDHLLDPLLLQGVEVLQDIRAKPGVARPSTPALVDERPAPEPIPAASATSRQVSSSCRT